MELNDIMKSGKNRAITINEASSILGVSSSTVRNWVKYDYIKPRGEPGISMFNSVEIQGLKDKIKRGDIARLKIRANKAGAGRTFIPEEYIEDKSNRDMINFLVSYITERNIDTKRSLFLLGLNILKREKIIKYQIFSKTSPFAPLGINKSAVEIELNDWYRSLGFFEFREEYDNLLSYNIPEERDFLGIIYQSLLNEGTKSGQGSYYTPQYIIDEIASENINSRAKILDPCCGSGNFLLSFAQTVDDPGFLYGFDKDETAVRIARLNLFIKYKNFEFTPNVFHMNTLLDPGGERRGAEYGLKFSDFDIVATNPPWGNHYNRDELAGYKKIYPQIASGESFSYFLVKSIDLLKENGKLFFILPESIMNVKIHRDIRKFMIDNSGIEKIICMGRVFKNVFTPVIRLDLIKTFAKKRSRTLILNGESCFYISREKYTEDENHVISVNTSGPDDEIINKIYAHHHINLKEKAEWALGIVTGNNREFITGHKCGFSEEIITGRDIRKFGIKKPLRHIKFFPERFQQMAPIGKYRSGEKLVYRFISKNLVFAYDDMKRLTLNSANCVMPKIEGYPVKAILALFNSSLYQFLFQKKFSSLKVLRGHLEELPLPLWEKSVLDDITFMVDAILKGKDYQADLDVFIMNKYNLTMKEMKRILKLEKDDHMI